MDLSIYIDMIMKELQQSNYYTELDDRKLENIITQYLYDEYDRAIEELQFEADIKHSKNTVEENQYYKSRLVDIKSKMISLVREISKSKKD